ncbi:MAG: DUF4253 domain-containing protein [Hyphomicrobium aestuarii]|nr:DUF4253 domain-containing protein [Hyphomicrobium aestuarii]
MHLDVLPAGTALGAEFSPFPLIRVRASDALDALGHLRIVYPGQSPVLFGDLPEAERLLASRDRRAPVGIVAASLGSSAADLLERHSDAKNGRGGGGRQFHDRLPRDRSNAQAAANEDDAPPFDADGPLPPPHTAPQVLIDHRTGVAKPEVVIGLIPSPDAFEAAAHLGYGGFGSCPVPEVHVGFARDWQRRYGARVVAITPDVIEFQVARPVASREDALALAWVHYRYCPDLVTHLVGSIEGLAATLNGARYWHFWWERQFP